MLISSILGFSAQRPAAAGSWVPVSNISRVDGVLAGVTAISADLAADAGAGVGSMTDISCVDEDTCFAVSACDQTACADGIYASNHSHGYGGYIHRTTDGGDTWAILHFEYEMAIPPRALDAPRRLDRLRDDVQHAVELLRRLQVRAGGGRVRRPVDACMQLPSLVAMTK